MASSRGKKKYGKVLVTGGTGYIGSHTAVALMSAGYDPVIVDNLSNSHISVLDRIELISVKRPFFHHVDLRDGKALREIFRKHQINSVIHFAGFKSVNESVIMPLNYYENNIQSTLSLCQIMSENDVKRLIFSSSAAIYGDSSIVPVSESLPPAPTNPYARTKLMIEQILQDMFVADPSWRIILLRYFNPVGAHESGLMGEDPQDTPNNLVPFVSQVAIGRRKRVNVFGNDYPTEDGTGIRDYIHVMDLAEGHVAALKKMEKTDLKKKKHKPEIINLGTGRGYSVLEVIHAFSAVSGKNIPLQITKRRPGDIAISYADTTLARDILKWKAKRTIIDMCASAWRWQSKNPYGYSTDTQKQYKNKNKNEK